MDDRKQAIRPGMFSLRKYAKEERELDEETLTDDEKVLANGAEQKFWLVLKKHLESEIDQIDRIAEAAIESGASTEEIGQNTIVVTQVKGLVRRLFNIVDDASEALKNEGT